MIPPAGCNKRVLCTGSEQYILRFSSFTLNFFMWCLSFQGNTVFMSYTKDHRPRIAIIWDVHKYRFHKLSMYIVHIKDECGTHTFVMYEVN